MRRGFTLLELLVVVGILGLMASILFPVFARAKRSAYRTVSLSNVRQITLAQFLYMDDYAGAVAINRDCHLVDDGGDYFAECRVGRGYRGWVDLTEPYVNSYAVFKSPADPTAEIPLPTGALDSTGHSIRHGVMWGPRNNGQNLLGGDFRSSYARNNNFANNGTYTARIAQAEFPASLVLIYSFTPNSGAGANASEGIPGSTFTLVRRPAIVPPEGACRLYEPRSGGNEQANYFGALPDYGQQLERAGLSSERYDGRGIYGLADGHARALPANVVKGQCGWGNSSGVEFGNNGRDPDFRF